MQANIDRIDEYVNDVAHLDSPNYGNHWSAERVAKTFAPTVESIEAVRGWLVDAGFARERVRVVRSRGWIEVNATVEEAERLLRTEYHVYRHEDSGQGHVGSSFELFFDVDFSGAVVLIGMAPACDEYHLPEHIRPHVELVMPTVHFDAVIRRRDSNGSAAKIGQPGYGHGPRSGGTIDIHAETQDEANSVDRCDVAITLACLRRLYGIPDSWQPKAADRNSLGIGWLFSLSPVVGVFGTEA
jgi:tripeptidyl-peptidase-1